MHSMDTFHCEEHRHTVLLKSTGDLISYDSFDRNIRITDAWIGLCDLFSKNTQRIMRLLS